MDTSPPTAQSQFSEKVTPGRFARQTVLVTGAGSGIGLAVALRVAREGGRVIAADWNAGRLEAMKQAHPALDLVTVHGDISDEDDVQRIVQVCDGRCDALANNAGIMDGFQPVGDVSDEIWERVLRVNVTGTMRMTRAVLPLMTRQGHGRIVNIISVAGLIGAAAGAAYTTAKHALVGLTRNTAFMYAPQGIRVNAVAPAGVVTNIEARFASALGQSRIEPRFAMATPHAQPEELAATICFLLSEDSPNVTGAILPSDGGWTAF